MREGRGQSRQGHAKNFMSSGERGSTWKGFSGGVTRGTLHVSSHPGCPVPPPFPVVIEGGFMSCWASSELSACPWGTLVTTSSGETFPVGVRNHFFLRTSQHTKAKYIDAHSHLLSQDKKPHLLYTYQARSGRRPWPPGVLLSGPHQVLQWLCSGGPHPQQGVHPGRAGPCTDQWVSF